MKNAMGLIFGFLAIGGGLTGIVLYISFISICLAGFAGVLFVVFRWITGI